MAVWIDEDGTIVRPAEGASIERSPLRDMEIPEGLPERIDQMLREVKKIPDDAEDYRAAIVDWVRPRRRRRGSRSSPDEVVARSQPRGADEARARPRASSSGEHLLPHRRPRRGGAVVARGAPRCTPANWTYKRQAWTLVTTPEGATENDLMQGPNDVYEGNWLDDVAGRWRRRGTTPSCPSSEPAPTTS